MPAFAYGTRSPRPAPAEANRDNTSDGRPLFEVVAVFDYTEEVSA
jgi:hypothetical protein